MAVFAAAEFGGVGLPEGTSTGHQFYVQVVGVLTVAILSGVVTWVIAKTISATVGLRVSEEEEIDGLDISAHGERGYDLT